MTIRAHFDGHVIVPEQPLQLPRNTRLTVQIEPDVTPLQERRGFQPLSIALDPAVSQAIAEDPDFGIEES